jgi:hypothetical protein
VKTHYQLLGLEPTADAGAIKKAFRREIARYHPDKVIHLGAEFQEMAATRAAELTIAYKTLSDEKLRAEYDAGLTSAPVAREPPATPAASTEPVPASPAPPRPPVGYSSPHAEFRTPTIDEIRTPHPPGNPARFQAERSDRDLILRRAISARVLSTVEAIVGKCETPAVRGFDLVMVPLAKPRFLGTPPVRVLVRVVGIGDAAAIAAACNDASRARLHAGKSPVMVLLFSRKIAPQSELSKAWDVLARQRKAADAPEAVDVVVVDVADWSCRMSPNCSTAVRKLADQICVS